MWVYDDKSREGTVVKWEKTQTGYSVFVSSQKSGTDPEIAAIAGRSLDVLGKVVDKAPIVP